MTKIVTTYNGWTNYETWAVSLWLNNNEGTYHVCRNWAQQARAEAEDQKLTEQFPREAEGILADRLKEFVEDNSPLAGSATLYTDLLNAAIGETDWYEVAQAFLEE